ncbi:nuclear pore complex protein Nup214 isoform X2 [Aquarana catesbeiana]|uniref:nuclear pore complex protein Nup214 isoform X2 n=1 Tax=Aquarana catesbeiana TaxID=8400 RepID=UPI003CC99BFF
MEEDTDAPPERDTKDFVFRQLTKLRIFEPPQDLPKDRSALLAISNKYGVLFVGSPFGLKIFSTNDVLIPIKTGVDPNSIAASPPGIDVPTKYPVHHVAMSSDNLTLSVCMSSSDSGCIISFYDTRTLLNKARQPKQTFASQRLLQDAGSFVTDLKWNPVASTVAVCLSDGSISVLQVTDTISLYASLPPATGVTSVCWSPKGKQLAVGKQNGTVVQYLPNLQEKKVIPCPSFYDSDNPVKVLDVLWISTYVFAVVYAAADGSVETSPQLVMVLLPKKEDKRGERFLNFTEICYCSVNNERQHHFFMNYMEDWGVLLGASAASIEVSVIAKLPDQNTWELWILEDAGRAELPLSDNSDDTLPMGVVLDYTSRLQIEITEEKVLPPSPILMILSTDGVLCPFHVINYNPNVKSLTTPLEELRLEGERQPKSASSVPSHPPQGPGAPSSTISAINPAFSIPVSSLASKVQPTPPAFSLPVTTSKPAQVFTPATASFPSKPQTTSQVFGAPAASFPSKPQATAQGFGATVPSPSKPQTTSQVFSAPAASFPSKPQATAQGFGATVPSPSKPQTTSQVFGAPAASFPSKPQATAQGFGATVPSPSKPQASASHFGVTGPVGKPQESTAGFSFSTNLPSASAGTAHPGFSVPSNPQGFSSAVQGPPAFGTSTSKTDNSTNIAQQAASSSFAFSTSNVKMNLSAKFSAVDEAATKPAFTPHSQSYPLTPPVKSTVAAVPQSSIGPPSIQSASMMAPNRSFPDGHPQQATPVMRQKALKISSSEVKQTPPQPQATNPILNAIQEEIAHFQKEMDELKARTAKACFIVGTAEEMRRLKTECNDLDSFVRDIKATTESLHNDNGCLQTTLRDAFTTVQDAKELNEKKKNPVYCRLLQQRPLDPKSEAQMQEIRRLNQYVEYAIQDVNNVLDYRWDQYLYNKKKLRGFAVPQRETLFNTLASHQEIISQQRQLLNQLVAQLQELRLYNQTSQLTIQIDTSNGQRQFEEELKNLQIAMSKTALETKPQPSPKKQPKISKLKLNQLRNFLANRKPPVVRSLAPANLCRSSFLAASYYEDLDDVSSTSSLSEAADNEEMQAPPQHEAFKQETPPPELSAVRTVRHAPVTRTASMQPGFGTPSLPFGKSQSQIGPITSTPAVPAQSIRVIPQGADSTMLATKTVKHGAPTVTASQAAAAAALRRQMSCQVSASLTESTLQTVPQVVNVKELKSNGPGPNISTVIGPSVPQSAAQVINQVLVTVGSAPAKQAQLQPPSGFKTPSASAPTSNVIAQSGSGLATNKTGQTSSKFEAQTTTSSTGLTSGLNKAFSFSGPSGVFPMGNGAPSSVPSSSLGSIAQVKDASLPTPFINNNGNKFHFGLGTEANFAFGPPKPATGISTAGPLDSTSAKSTSAQAPPLTTSLSTGGGMAAAQTFTGGETLGSFSGLRVGQAEEVPKTEPPKVTPSIQPVKISGGSPLTGIGGFQPSKPVEPASTTSSSSTIFGNMKLTNPGITGVFNSTGIKQNFSFTTPATTTSETEVSSTTQVASSLPFGGFIAPSTSLQTPTTTVSASLPTPVPSSTTVEAKQPAPEKPLNEPVALPPQLQALLAAATGSSKEPASALTISTAERTMATVPAVMPTVAKTTTPVSVFSTTASSNLNVPITSTPTSIGHLSPPAATTSEGPSSKTPVLVTSAPTLGPTSTPVTPASAGSTATASSFGQPPVAPAPTATTTAGSLFGQTPAPSTGTLFGQPSNTSTTTSGITTSGFGTPGFGSADGGGGFGQPTFGQTASLWKAPANSASNFSFAPSAFGSQPAFGQAPASTAATSSGGSLFGGSTNTSSASSFSFGQPSSSNNASTSGGGLFGQSSTPVFGQGSTFGQSAPVFGSASSSTTTTTSSSAFSFAQPSAFGSNSTGSVFGQSQSGNANVFGQASSTSGGLFGSSSNSTGGGFFSGLGGKPSQEAANKNPFGSSNTGFGSPSSASGFGAAPVFGSPPTFGGSPGFGGVPAFGSAPNFSSPLGSNGGKVFGEGTAAANTGGFGFGSNTPTATFGNLASQTTPTFGTLSQQGPGFGGQNSGFSGFGSGSGGAASGNSGGFAFGASNQSTSAFGGGWRG